MTILHSFATISDHAFGTTLVQPIRRAHRAGVGLRRPLLLPFGEIHGIHVQLLQDLELYHGQRLYVLTPGSERASSHFYERLILTSQELCFTG